MRLIHDGIFYKGIHVCWSITEALQWGPRVVRVSVPMNATIVSNGKLRIGPYAKVEEVDVQIGANLDRANLVGANLGEWERGPDGYARRKS